MTTSTSSVHLILSYDTRNPVTALIYDRSHLTARGSAMRNVFMPVEDRTRMTVGSAAARHVDGQMR